MKVISSLILCFFTTYISAWSQAFSQVDNCHSILYELIIEDENISGNKYIYTVILEKELSNNIWLSLTKENSTLPFGTFDNLDKGHYRVTIVKDALKTTDKNAFPHNEEKSKSPAFLTYISNAVDVVGLDNCKGITYGIHARSKYFDLYPNPASNEATLFVKRNLEFSDNYTLQLTDINGKVILREKNVQMPFSINTSTLIDGVYILQLTDKAHHKILDT